MFDLNLETMISAIFSWKFFAILEKIFSKMKYFVRSSLFLLKTTPQIFYNCSQHERVLKILYFHIFNIANLTKFMYGLSPIEQHHKVEKKNTSWFSLRIFKNNLSRFWAFLFTMAPTWDVVHSRLRKRVGIFLPIVRK